MFKIYEYAAQDLIVNSGVSIVTAQHASTISVEGAGGLKVNPELTVGSLNNTFRSMNALGDMNVYRDMTGS